MDESKKIKIFMAGDSTMMTYGDSMYPMQGWGAVLNNFFDSSKVEVDNTKSMGGRTSKTFIIEDRLEYIKNNISEGDYLFVQFGHNDAKTGDVLKGGTSKVYLNYHTGIGSYATDYNGNLSDVDGENTSYFAYLQNYVDVARDKKANIVLFTSFNREYNNENNLNGYPAAVRAFATENDITLVDTTSLSIDLYNKMLEVGQTKATNGNIKSAKIFAQNIFCYFTANDSRYDATKLAESNLTKSNTFTDSTHFNLYGAEARARIVAFGLKGAKSPLSRYLTETKTTMNDVIADIVENVPTPYYNGQN